MFRAGVRSAIRVVAVPLPSLRAKDPLHATGEEARPHYRGLERARRNYQCLHVGSEPARAVYDLAKAGVLVRVSRGQFLLEESGRRYCQHIRKSKSQPDGVACDQAASTTTETFNRSRYHRILQRIGVPFRAARLGAGLPKATSRNDRR
jgi:hypothetical protein